MKLPIKVIEDSKEPLYHQIEDQIKRLIVGGVLAPGTILPSIRALSSDLSCSLITTRRAYQNLENQGYIKTVQGKGTFVSQLARKMEDETKRDMVKDTLNKAIEQAQQMGCSLQDIHDIFKEVLKERGY